MSTNAGGSVGEEKTIFGETDGAATTYRREIDDAATTYARESDPVPPPPTPEVAAKAEPQRAPVREPQTVVAGRFVIDSALPSGREAESALGSDLLEPGRRVFIKRYRPERADAKFIAKRVEMRERLLALNHPNCMRMLALEPPREGRPLTEVYEYLVGEQLSATLARSPRPDDSFIRQALEQISAGLDAFQRTVSSVHRDIKPDNIMVTVQDGQARFVICDYGTATATHIGGVTTFEGTRYYAPPESQSPKQLRDEYLKKFDWWSVGRIIQEMADGRSARESIKAHVAGSRKEDDDAADAIFYSIVFGHGHGYNVRSGMVEWSNPAWRAPLRGLLTANRQLRWDYEQIRAWLAGASPADAYDADVDHQRFSFKGEDYDAADAARLLAQPEHWNDAVQQIVERTGIVAYIRKSGNLRVVQELERIFELHREVAPHDPQTADDLTVALALAAIGRAKEMPVTIRGTVLGPAIIADYATRERAHALAAVSHPRFLERLAAISPAQHAEIEGLVKRIRDLRQRIESFGESPLVLDRAGIKLARYVFVPDHVLRERVVLGCQTYATSDVPALAKALAGVERATADELAAIVYVFESGDVRFRLVTHASRERGEVEAVTRLSGALRRSFALAFLAPFLALSEQLGAPLRCAIVGFVCALGWIEILYSPLWVPATLAEVFAGCWAASALAIFGCLRLMNRALVHFASARASLTGRLPKASVCSREAAAVRRSVLAGSECTTLLSLRAKTNARIRALRPRHPDLRTVPIPIPVAPLLSAFGAAVVIAALPLGAVAFAERLMPVPDAVSTSALAARLTTAYISGNVSGAERYAQGPALANLRNIAFVHIVRRRLAAFGAFRGAREEMLNLGMPGRSIVGLQFAHRRIIALLVHSPRNALDFQIRGIMPTR